MTQLLKLLTWSRTCNQATSLVDNAWRVVVETIAQSSTDFQKTIWTKFPQLPTLMDELLLGEDASIRIQTSRRLHELCLLDKTIGTK